MATDKDDNSITKKKNIKKIDNDSFDDIELDLDLDGDDSDINSDTTELEDIDLDDDTDDTDDTEDTDNKNEFEDDELKESAQKLFNEIKILPNDKSDEYSDENGIGIFKINADSSPEKRGVISKLLIIQLKVEELKNIGLDISIINDLINEAKNFIEDDDINSAKTLLKNSENLASSIIMDHRMNLISTIISFIETFIFELTEFEFDFKYAEAYFAQAKASLVEKDLNSANRYLGDTIQNVRKVLDNTRSKKIEEALKFYEFWFKEINDLAIDTKKLNEIMKNISQAFESEDIEAAEQYLQKLTASSKAEINKNNLKTEIKEDYIQQLDGIYEFEDFSSLSDALKRAKNMLNESIEKDLTQEKMNQLITTYNSILNSRIAEIELDYNTLMAQFIEAKDAFEKEDFELLAMILEKINSQIGKTLVVGKKTDKTKDIKREQEQFESNNDNELEVLDELDELEGLEELEDLENLECLEDLEDMDDIEDLENITDVKDIESSEKVESPESSEPIKEKIKQDGKTVIEGLQKGVDENQISEQMKKLITNLELAKQNEIDTKVPEDLLSYAKQRIKSKKYSDALDVLEHAQEVLDNKISEAEQERKKEEAMTLIRKSTEQFDILPEDHPELEKLKELLENAKNEFDNEDYDATLKFNAEFSKLIDDVKISDLPTKSDKIQLKEPEPPKKKDIFKKFQEFEKKNEIDEDDLISGIEMEDSDSDSLEDAAEDIPENNIGENMENIKDNIEDIEDIEDISVTENELNGEPETPMSMVDEPDTSEGYERDSADSDYQLSPNELEHDRISDEENFEDIEDLSPNNIPDQDDEMISDSNIIEPTEYNNDSPEIALPNTKELIKEAFGFKISRDSDRYPSTNLENDRAFTNLDSREALKPKPEEIEKIRNNVMSKMNNKVKQSRQRNFIKDASPRKPFPHELREMEMNGMIDNRRIKRNNHNFHGSKNNIEIVENGESETGTSYEHSVLRPPIINGRQKQIMNNRVRTNKQQKVYVTHSRTRDQQLEKLPRFRDSSSPEFADDVVPGYGDADQVEGQEQYERRMNVLKKDALKGLQEIQSIISDTYYFGANINELERISEDARNAFDDRDYQEVLLYVDKCEELSRRLKLSYMQSLISEFKISGENSQYLEYLFNETEDAYNNEKYKIGDELARRFINVTRDTDVDNKISTQTWMYCRYCGNAIPRDSTFCSYCGDKLL